MAQEVKHDIVSGPLGDFEVSTIRTPAGGAPKSYGMFGMFSDDNFEDCNIWPFETMIFKKGTRRGLYHAPLGSREEAEAHHAQMCEVVRSGAEFGGGVTDCAQGLPTCTREQWESRSKVTV